MKLNGKTPGAPKPETVVFSRGDEADFAFIINAVLDYKEFNKLVPEPKPAVIRKPGEPPTTESVNSPEYRQRYSDYGAKKTNWMILKSLEQTPGLEWETINMEKPDTWGNFQQELNDAGFTDGEVAHLIDQIARLHIVDEKRMREALDRFIASASVESGV